MVFPSYYNEARLFDPEGNLIYSVKMFYPVGEGEVNEVIGDAFMLFDLKADINCNLQVMQMDSYLKLDVNLL